GPGRPPRPVHCGDGGDARRARRRDHRLDVRRAEERMAAARPRRAAAQGDRPSRRARGERIVTAAAHEHHGPPPIHYSSRVAPAILGMFLFIASEVMLFGSFFTVYFFDRVVHHGFFAEWPPP